LSSLEKEFKTITNMQFKQKPDSKSGAVRGDFALATQNLMNATYAFGWTLAHPESVSVSQKKMTTSVKNAFVKWVNREAAANPQAFWHMYEGHGHVGTGKRLFNLAAPKKNLKSSVSMSLVYLPDSSMARVDPRLWRGGSLAGKKGQYVKKRHRWPTKAFDLELGKTLNIKVKKSKYLVFVGRGKGGKPKAVFIRGPVVVDTSKGRGGKRPTMGAMTQAAIEFSKYEAPEVAMRSYKRQTKLIREAVEQSRVARTRVSAPSRQLAESVARRVSATARREGVV